MKRTAFHSIRVGTRPGRKSQGWLFAGPLAVPVALGRTGIRADKREGDGGTPRGRFRPLRVWWRADRLPRPQTSLPIRRVLYSALLAISLPLTAQQPATPAAQRPGGPNSGPAPAPLLKAESFYRHQIMLRARAMSKLSQTLAKIIPLFALPEDVTLTVDIDPVNLA